MKRLEEERKQREIENRKLYIKSYAHELDNLLEDELTYSLHDNKLEISTSFSKFEKIIQEETGINRKKL